MTPDDDLLTLIDRMSAFELIDALDKLFPERCISPLDSLESAHRYAGRRELINELLEIKEIDLNATAED